MITALKRLAEVAQLNPRGFDSEIDNDSLVSFVPMKAVEEESGRLDARQTKRWGEVRKGYTPFQDGDVVFAKITPCMENGKYALASGLHGGRAAGSTEFHVFRPKPELNPKYLLWFLFSPEVRREAKRSMRGAAGQLRVPPIFFQDLDIPVPPLDYQEQIVAEIEKQFTRLDAGVALLKRVQTALKRYRATVLKAACEGRLVPTEAELARQENRTYETGEQLLQRILKDRREKWNAKGRYKEPKTLDRTDLPALPAGWTYCPMELLAEIVDPQPSHRTPAEVPDGVPYIGIGDARVDGNIDVLNARKVGRKVFEEHQQRYQLRDGDFIVGKIGTVGKAVRLKQPFDYALSANVVLIQPSPMSTRHGFLQILIESPETQRQFSKGSRATTQAAFGIQKFRQLPTALPPLMEQTRIVAEVERRLSVVEEFQKAVSECLQRSAQLRQAILQQAFSGRLAITNGAGNL